jgi:uncharacterized lipoprotein YmbA
MSFDDVIEINVLRFDPDDEGKMVLSTQTAIMPRHSSTSGALRSFVGEAPFDKNSVPDLVAAMSRLWAALADQISTGIVATDDQ